MTTKYKFTLKLDRGFNDKRKGFTVKCDTFDEFIYELQQIQINYESEATCYEENQLSFKPCDKVALEPSKEEVYSAGFDVVHDKSYTTKDRLNYNYLNDGDRVSAKLFGQSTTQELQDYIDKFKGKKHEVEEGVFLRISLTDYSFLGQGNTHTIIGKAHEIKDNT